MDIDALNAESRRIQRESWRIIGIAAVLTTVSVVVTVIGLARMLGWGRYMSDAYQSGITHRPARPHRPSRRRSSTRPPRRPPTTHRRARCDRLTEFAQAGGDISDLLTDAELTELGVKAVREWRIDAGYPPGLAARRPSATSTSPRKERAEEDQRDPLLGRTGANIYCPLLTIGALSFAAKA